MKSKNNRILWKLHRTFREVSSSLRVLPDFYIMGTPFSAKTLLYRYLIQHPMILKNFRNETSYFDLNYNLGINWYKSNFPTSSLKNSIKKKYGKALVGETINMGSPYVAKRLSELISNPKIIFIVRNPTERAYAKYLEEVRAQNEKESFENALKFESNRIKKSNMSDEKEKFLTLHNRQWFLYKKLGLYSEFLTIWRNYFPIEKILTIKAEDLFQNPQKTVSKCCDYLGLDLPFEFENIGINHDINELDMSIETRKELDIFFKPYNKKLYHLLNNDLKWEN